MVNPDVDFEDDFDDDDPVIEASAINGNEEPSGSSKPDQKSHDTRRKIEEILEARRLKEEFGDLAL